MENTVCTNVVEINPQGIENLIPMVSENILRNRQLSALIRLEGSLLEPYKAARKEAEFHNRVESFKKKKDRQEVKVPDIRVIDADLKRDLKKVAIGDMEERQMNKYMEVSLSDLDRQMLVNGLRNMRQARSKRMNYQEELSRQKTSNGFFCTERSFDTSKFVLPGDIIQMDGKAQEIQKVTFQALDQEKWKLEYYANNVLYAYNQKDSGGCIIRESKHNVRNFDEIIDEFNTKEAYNLCEIHYIDLSNPNKKLGRVYYPIHTVSFKVNTLEKGWKYRVNNLWEEYREVLHLRSRCVVELNFSQE